MSAPVFDAYRPRTRQRSDVDWCRALWSAVALQALRDAMCVGSYGWHEQDWAKAARAVEAERWLRDDPDGVLEWLGVDGGAALERARRSGLQRRQMRGVM